MSKGLKNDLHTTSDLKWTENQEKSLLRDYPFSNLANETVDQFFTRTYLQFLWLPESIMPLQFLVPSLSRADSFSAQRSFPPEHIHPLHPLIDSLLINSRACSKKYQSELPQLLAHGGGAGEVEETMMWYALGYEKGENGPGEDTRDRTILNDASNAEISRVSDDEGWRKKWLGRMERREVQIQILLRLLKLSLPGSSVLSDKRTGRSPSKKRRRSTKEPKVTPTSLEDQLEFFMDKLSMWQLALKVNHAQKPNERQTAGQGAKADDPTRDWTQIFCQDIVEPQFQDKLPVHCSLLRSKVFPNVHKGNRDAGSSPSSSPSPKRDKKKQQKRQRTFIPGASSNPTASSSKSVGCPSTPPDESTAISDNASRTLVRNRSRSLSVSLAQESENARRSASGGKRALNREVSMSRVFKGKVQGAATSEGANILSKSSSLASLPFKGSALRRQTSAKEAQLTSQPQVQRKDKKETRTLVEDTPVKVKDGFNSKFGGEKDKNGGSIKHTRGTSNAPLSVSRTLSSGRLGLRGDLDLEEEALGEEEEDWGLDASFGSGAAVELGLMGRLANWNGEDDSDVEPETKGVGIDDRGNGILVPDTPMKPRGNFLSRKRNTS